MMPSKGFHEVLVQFLRGLADEGVSGLPQARWQP